jgi:hypothetical protein
MEISCAGNCLAHREAGTLTKLCMLILSGILTIGLRSPDVPRTLSMEKELWGKLCGVPA